MTPSYAAGSPAPLSASRGPQWVCDKCQHTNAVWSPVCDNCGGFDTLSWREPPRRRCECAVRVPTFCRLS
jgi:hypothetical protein